MRYVSSGVSRFTVTVTMTPTIKVASPLLQPMREAFDGFEFETFSGVFIEIIFRRDLMGLREDNQMPFVRRDRYRGTGALGDGQIGLKILLSQ